MPRTPSVLVAAMGLMLMASSASAQFATTEVSPPGSATPFRVTKALWSWEDLGPVSYSVHRSAAPDGGFTCILDLHPATTWTGDQDPFPAGRLWHYLVTAFDGAVDNSPGRRSDGTPRVIDTWCPRPQACCLVDASCQDLELAACGALGGTAQGFGTSCDTIACPPPLQACCLPDNSCVDLLPVQCAVVGGTTAGPGTTCATTSCTPPAEACCLPDGSCLDTDPPACLALGGTAQGAGTACATTACPPPAEACCLANLACDDLSPADCLVQCGLAQGPGTTCATTTCARRPLQLVDIGPAFTSPIFLTAPAGDSRLFVLERAGRIILQRTDGSRATYLDISTQVRTGGERGALGLAFHPDYATNGRFYVHYSRAASAGCGTDHCSTISEFTVSANPDAADAASERIVLQLGQPFSNHNGGWTAFGPDGYLYIGFGDGGSGGDPLEAGQDLGTLLGKILRIDVDRQDPGLGYAIPADNPFTTPGRPEIWSYGVRNPWRNAFDRATDDFYIADVGQNRLEEIDVATVALGAGRGQNYGWDDMEGTDCFEPMVGCDTTGKVLPDHQYTHGAGCSITGGYVYRGCAMPDWDGWYFFADYCSEWIDAFHFETGVASTLQRVFPGGTANAPVSFGEDAAGEIYLVNGAGMVQRIAPR